MWKNISPVLLTPCREGRYSRPAALTREAPASGPDARKCAFRRRDCAGLFLYNRLLYRTDYARNNSGTLLHHLQMNQRDFRGLRCCQDNAAGAVPLWCTGEVSSVEDKGGALPGHFFRRKSRISSVRCFLPPTHGDPRAGKGGYCVQARGTCGISGAGCGRH